MVNCLRRTSHAAVEDGVIAWQYANLVHHVRMVLVLQVLFHLYLFNSLVTIGNSVAAVVLACYLLNFTADFLIIGRLTTVVRRLTRRADLATSQKTLILLILFFLL